MYRKPNVSVGLGLRYRYVIRPRQNCWCKEMTRKPIQARTDSDRVEFHYALGGSTRRADGKGFWRGRGRRIHVRISAVDVYPA